MSGKFTESRKAKAEKILDNALQKLISSKGKMLPTNFEDTIEQCWNLGYQELKPIMIEMLKDEKYQSIAVKYMTQFNIVAEFKRPLADFLSIKKISEGYTNALQRYWDQFNNKNK